MTARLHPHPPFSANNVRYFIYVHQRISPFLLGVGPIHFLYSYMRLHTSAHALLHCPSLRLLFCEELKKVMHDRYLYEARSRQKKHHDCGLCNASVNIYTPTDCLCLRIYIALELLSLWTDIHSLLTNLKEKRRQ